MEQTEFLFRWLHVIAGIVWIGHLYFFNFVNIPLQGSLDDAGKKIVNPQLMPRALWWFRWGAMLTFVSGLLLFYLIYMHGSTMKLKSEDGLTDQAKWIMLGMAFGTLMWANVWMVIWPAQKKLLGGTAGDQAPALRARAMLASRINTYSSAPMLFGMLGANHAGMAASPGAMLAVIVVGMGLIWVAYYHSPIVGKTV